MKFHDLGERPSKDGAIAGAPKGPKVYYQSLNITSKQVPELVDYELGDVVDFHIRSVVVAERKTTDQPKSIDLEMRKAAIINLKKIRQDAEDMGLSVDDVKDIDAGRKKKNA
ncbi:unnamed protein product [marine sediment metagenome]|uniref:Uncharacterized protein n=1 Tax=marine sediment metagenome TaxID=412755 RepID=X0UGS7_9ZZZZ